LELIILSHITYPVIYLYLFPYCAPYISATLQCRLLWW